MRKVNSRETKTYFLNLKIKTEQKRRKRRKSEKHIIIILKTLVMVFVLIVVAIFVVFVIVSLVLMFVVVMSVILLAELGFQLFLRVFVRVVMSSFRSEVSHLDGELDVFTLLEDSDVVLERFCRHVFGALGAKDEFSMLEGFRNIKLSFDGLQVSSNGKLLGTVDTFVNLVNHLV